MNKTQMIDAIAKQTKLTKVDVSKVLNSLVCNVVSEVAAGKSFTIIGFGTFKSAKRQAREGRNPSTGAKIRIPAATLPKFTAGKKFKEAVNGKKGKKAPCKACKGKKGKK